MLKSVRSVFEKSMVYPKNQAAKNATTEYDF